MTTYDFETGAPGNTATLGNTGFALISAGAGNSITIDNVGAVSGANSIKYTLGNTTNSCYCEAAAEAGAPVSESLYIAITLSSDGYAVDTTLWQGFLADDTSTFARILVTSAGLLRISDISSAHVSTLAASVTAQYGSTIVVRLQLSSGSTTSNGVMTARWYSSPSLAVGSFTAEITASNWNLGAGGAYGKTRLGINTAQSSLGANGRTTRFDYYVIVSGVSWVASPTAAAVPTANAGVDLYGQSGTTFALAGSGTIGSGGGAITGYAWTLLAKARPDMATPTIVSPNSQNTNVTGLDPGWYDINLVVTQSGGGLSSTANTVRLWVHPPSGVAVKPVSVTKATGITREGTATTDEAALYDTDNASLLRWPDAPTGELITIVWAPCGPSNPTFQFDGLKIGTGTLTTTINEYWEDSTTLLDGPYTWTPGGQTTFPAGLSPAAITALGSTLPNRRALVTKITSTA